MKNYFIRIAITLCFFAVAICNTFAATITWTGGGATPNWNNPANWNTNSVPLATDNVIINMVANQPIITSAVVRSATTTFNEGVNCDINAGSITNSGTFNIIANTGMDPNFFYVYAGTSFTNNGTVNLIGQVYLIISSGTFNNNSAGVVNLTGNASLGIIAQITSDDSGIINNSGTINLAGYTVFGNQNGSATISNTGTIQSTIMGVGNEITLLNDNTITGNGTINCACFYKRSDSNPGTSNTSNTVILKPGGLIGGFNQVDCFNFTNGLTSTGGNFAFSLSSGVACTNFDKITVTGTATLGGQFMINQVDGSLPLNSEYIVLTATTNISGNFTNTSVPVANGFAVPIINNSVNPKTLTIKIQATAALPVELVTFKGEKRNRENVLFWETASETNNRGFEVEISNDGSHFEKMAFVKGRGTTSELQNYNFTHTLNAKQNGVLYYRLKQLDNDGKFEYSKIIEIGRAHV